MKSYFKNWALGDIPEFNNPVLKIVRQHLEILRREIVENSDIYFNESGLFEIRFFDNEIEFYGKKKITLKDIFIASDEGPENPKVEMLIKQLERYKRKLDKEYKRENGAEISE